ncbi:hypothetical protein D3C78_1591460 [compost metagenome]
MPAQDFDGAKQPLRQALLVDLQLVQPQQDLGRYISGTELGELHAAEEQVVGVDGNVLQLQPVRVGQPGELALDVVLAGGQEGQGIAQHRVMGFELFHQARLFLDQLEVFVALSFPE